MEKTLRTRTVVPGIFVSGNGVGTRETNYRVVLSYMSHGDPEAQTFYFDGDRDGYGEEGADTFYGCSAHPGGS